MHKKILLINPPFYRLMNSHFNGLSLGLGYIASVLKNNGHVVKIYNADYLNENHYANQIEIFKSYEGYKNTLNNLKHPIWHEIRNVIDEFSPDVVGITALTGTYKSAGNIAKITKDIDLDIIVIIGGVHPTLLPDETIKNELFDFVIRGEGEQTFLELVNGTKKDNIAGLTYRDHSGNIIHNPPREYIKNLDTLPFPARELYLNEPEGMDYGYIMTGRGCPFECTYCASKKIWNRKTRFRSEQNVIEEIKHVFNTFGTRSFYFIDDTFTLNQNRAKRICQMIVDEALDIEWICDTRIDTLDEELLQLMKKAGCTRIKIGVESGSERILKKIKKGLTKEQIRTAVSMIKDVGIDLTIYLMIGFPTETDSEALETIEFAKELNPTYCSLSILAPYPGTEVYDDMIESGVELPKEHWEYFFHQSKDMILTLNIKESTVNKFFSLNDVEGKSRT